MKRNLYKKSKEKKSFYKEIEKRVYSRVETNLDTKYIIVDKNVEGTISSGKIHGKISNISISGACLVTNVIHADGHHISSSASGLGKNRLKIEIELLHDLKAITPLGEVLWYNLSPEEDEYLYNVGIAFVEMSKQDKDNLKKFITKEKRGERICSGFLGRFFSGT